MYIYMIIKLLVEFFVIKNKLDVKYLFMFIEGSIIIGYFYLLYLEELNINKYLLVWSIGWIIFFVSYKSMNYLLVNREKILIQIKQRISEEKIKEIKEFFLKPIVCDIVYYLIWMLPWNIGYWIYFYVMEHGWYLRVWITSTRDIVILKIFKWDSRMFFYSLNEKIYKNKLILIIWKIKEEILKGILRILLVISWVREKMLKKGVIEYIIWRILAFCYLSMFYLYVFEGIQIINKWIIIIIISIEIILIIISGKVIEKLLIKDIETKKYQNVLILIEFININNLYLIIDPLNYTWSQEIKIFFEQKWTVWNKILGNSVSLNILYEYMLYVNKNTEGYYISNYNILTRIKITKMIEGSNIPWDIIPRTRYVIYNLKYVQYNLGTKYIDILIEKQSMKEIKKIERITFDYRLKSIKNLYLSLFEKTYSKTSLLSIIYLLRANIELNNEFFRNCYYSTSLININIELDNFEKEINSIYLRYKVPIVILYLIRIHRNNPNLLNVAYILHAFTLERRIYDMEGYFMIELLGLGTSKEYLQKCLSEIPTKIISLIEYKQGVEILSLLTMFDEEAMTWNKDMMQFFNEMEKLKLNENFVEEYKEQGFKPLLNFMQENEMTYLQEWLTDEIVYKLLMQFYVIKLKNYNIEDIESFDLQYLLSLNLIIESIKEDDSYENMLECYNFFLKNLWELKINENNNKKK